MDVINNILHNPNHTQPQRTGQLKNSSYSSQKIVLTPPKNDTSTYETNIKDTHPNRKISDHIINRQKNPVTSKTPYKQNIMAKGQNIATKLLSKLNSKPRKKFIDDLKS